MFNNVLEFKRIANLNQLWFYDKIIFDEDAVLFN